MDIATTTIFPITHSQQQKSLIWLVFWHIIIIASSNFLVQYPFTIFGYHSTWGTLTFPFTFLTTDLTVRVLGAKLARKIIFLVMFPALALSYTISIAFEHSLSNDPAAILTINWPIARIAIASFTAYIFGQLMDIKIFNQLRANANWWVAPTASTVIGNAFDTLIFYTIAFWHSSDPFMTEHWPGIGLLDYAFKLFISALFFLPIYGMLLKYLTYRLTKPN